jgi:hypothetical protein
MEQGTNENQTPRVDSAAKKAKDKAEANLYNKFAELHILMSDEKGFDKKKLKPEAYKRYEELKEEVLKIKGDKPKKTATAFIGIGQPSVRLVEGCQVPKSVVKIFEDAKIKNKWF